MKLDELFLELDEVDELLFRKKAGEVEAKPFNVSPSFG